MKPGDYDIIKRPNVSKVLARPSWDEYFMMTAKLAGTMGTCIKRRVGSIVIKNKRIVSTGFNGSPPGMPHCTEVGCLIIKEEGDSCQRVVHAEQNAVLQNSGVLEGSTLYTSYLPCLNCMKAIISAKIKEVVYEHESSKKLKYQLAKQFAEEAGLRLRMIPEVNIAEIVSRYNV